MSDKPEIKAGQRWVTHGAGIVRILATDGMARGCPVIVEDADGGIEVLSANGDSIIDDNGVEILEPYHLVSLAPFTVKREVALYRSAGETNAFACEFYAHGETPADGDDRRISEIVTIEFTLFPGECAA